MIVTFFAQDPTIYGYEQVSIWEGRFRNYAKVTKSTRGWTTTIRFGQPNILDEDGSKKRYPKTITADIQQIPNLPPPSIEEPDKAIVPWIYDIEVYEGYVTEWDTLFLEAFQGRSVGKITALMKWN
jgi:hypothetical protein